MAWSQPTELRARARPGRSPAAVYDVSDCWASTRGLAGAARIVQRDARGVVHVGLPGVIPAVGVDAQREAQVGMSILVAAESAADEAESLVGVGLRLPVAQPLGGGEGDPLDGRPVVPAAPR